MSDLESAREEIEKYEVSFESDAFVSRAFLTFAHVFSQRQIAAANVAAYNWSRPSEPVACATFLALVYGMFVAAGVGGGFFFFT